MFKCEFSKSLHKKVWYIPEKLNKYEIGTLAKFYYYKDTHKRHLFDKMRDLIKYYSGDKFDIIWNEFQKYASDRKSDQFILSQFSKHADLIEKHDHMKNISKMKISGNVYLDIGCGNGLLTMKAAKHFNAKKVYGADVKHLKTNKFNFIHTDGVKIAMKDDSVDIISIFSALHHIKDVPIDEIKRILKKNGSLIIYDNDVLKEFAPVMNVLHNMVDGDKVYYRDIKSIDAIVSLVAKDEIKFDGPLNIFIKRWTPHLKCFRVLTESIPRLKYKRRSRDIKNVIHWGQRKLLMNEIEFLTKFYKLFKPTKKVYVIYAGAAAGTHLIILKELFPEIYLELYDSNPFDKKLTYVKNLRMYNRYFFDSDAEFWGSDKHPDKHILLVSDIRTADTETMSSEEVETCVKTDHSMQRKWYELMKPAYSMFKFRLPWEDGETEYMSGQIYIQPWAPVTSTETRLIVKRNANLIFYDNRDYEERMFHYNIYEREMEYTNIFNNMTRVEKDGLDNRYDSVAEIEILRRCLRDDSKILYFSKKITKSIGRRSLMSSNPLKKGKDLIIKMKKIGMVPKNVALTQQTYNQYVIPNWEKLVSIGLIEKIPDEELFTR